MSGTYGGEYDTDAYPDAGTDGPRRLRASKEIWHHLMSDRWVDWTTLAVIVIVVIVALKLGH
jgi:hypothetical protein